MEPFAGSFRELVGSLDADGFGGLLQAVRERRCSEMVGIATIEDAAGLYRPDHSCPSCGAIPPRTG